MSPAVIAIVLAAAVMNVSWHVVLKTSGDPLRMSARALGGAVLVVTPLVALAWLAAGRPALSPLAWALAAASGAWELAYFIVLSAAYRRGDLSTVYPIARGTAAVGAVAAGLVLLGERPGPVALAGVAVLVAGGWFVRRPAMATRSSAVGWALLTGVTITGYSVVDAVGAREGPPWVYGWAMFAIAAAFLSGWVAVDARSGFSSRVAHRALARGGMAARLASAPDASSDAAPPWGRAIAAGLLILGAYFLVLYAYSVAPLSLVSPLRESAVVLATAWGILGLGEREGAAQRLGGAALIALGGVLVAIG